MYELKRKIGVLLGNRKDFLKKNILIRKMLNYINMTNSKQKNRDVKSYGVEVLKILYDESRKYGFHIWLDFGTLLGWYREKDFISFDMDLDFGVYKSDRKKCQMMKESLLKQGFKYVRKFEYAGEIVEESYSYHGLNIDIVYYEKKDALKNIWSYLVVYGMDINKRPIDIRGYLEQNTIERLVKAEFKGIQVEVPGNTEEYLKNYYGQDFMKPIPNFDWKGSGLYIELKDSSKCSVKVYDGEKIRK